jgi:AraC-like DNA-binding protein
LFSSSFLAKLGDRYSILSGEKSDYACGYIVRAGDELKNALHGLDIVTSGLPSQNIDFENDVMLLAYYRFILAAFEKFGEPLDSEIKSAGDCEQHIRIKTACTYIEEHLGENISVEKLAQIANYSTSHFFRLFTKIMGCTVKEYTDKLKICEAERLIKTGNHSITEIAYKLGFSHPNNLGRTYKRITGRNLKHDRSCE